MNDCPSCFATQECGRIPECTMCEFTESCRYCFENDGDKCDRTSGHVSFENYDYSEETAETAEGVYSFDNSSRKTDPRYTDEDLLKLMEFMLRIDDYSLGIVESVINGNLMTVSDAARVFKVSRQAMHRKILDSVRKHPELKNLFRANLYRCKKLRNEHLNHGENQRNKEREQMELF
jgi:hypothetical protein